MAVTSCQFLLAVIVTQKGLAYTRGLTKSLHRRASDICSASGYVETVIKTIQDVWSNDEQLHVWYTEAVQFADHVGSVPPELPRACRQGMDNNRAHESPEQFFRRTVTVPFLDNMLTHLKTRFGDAEQLATVSLRILPSVVKTSRTVGEELAKQLLQQHNDDIPDHANQQLVIDEVQQWCTLWRSCGGEVPDTLQAALQHKSVRAGLFPNIAEVLRLLLTLPVTTCDCKRRISELRLLKTFMRSTLGHDRLSSFALMHVLYRHPVNLDRVVNLFASRHPRRLALNDILEG